MVQYTELELVGKTFSAITHPSDQDVDMRLAAQVADGSRNYYVMTKQYIGKLGDIIPVKLKVVPVRKDDNFICFLSQIVPVEHRTPDDPSKINVKKWATWVTAGGSIIGYILAQVIKHIVED